MPESLPTWENADVDSLKPFSLIRIVTVDLDGTLIQLHQPNIWDNISWLTKSLNRVSSKVHLIIATGRTLAGAKKTIESLYGTKNLPIILYNGSLIIQNNSFEIYYKKTIPVVDLRYIIEFSEKYDIVILAYFYIDNDINLFTNQNTNEYVLGWTRGVMMETEFNGMTVIWEKKDYHLLNDPSAILIEISKESQENVSTLIQILLTVEGIDITSSGSRYIEIRPKGSNKAEALKHVSQLLDVQQFEIAAVGDNNNDAEMLGWAGIGLSVGNATQTALDQSKFKCNYDMASGVLEFLRLIKQSKRYINENLIKFPGDKK